MLRVGVGVLLALAATVPAAQAAPPANDARASAVDLGNLPARVSGTLVEATAEQFDPSPVTEGCRPVGPTVWYLLAGARAGRVALALRANGDLDAVVSVYRRDRSQLELLACDDTDKNGAAVTFFSAKRGEGYLVQVGAQPQSETNRFTLDVVRPEAPARGPGARLRGEARSSVDLLADADDTWSLAMRPGVTYRINLAPGAGVCMPLSLFPPGTRAPDEAVPARRLRCGGYGTFTPGPDEGGRWVLLVDAPARSRGVQGYRLSAGPERDDDRYPGRPIANGAAVRGRVSANGLDRLDVYRFDVSRRSDLTLTLSTNAAFDLRLVTDTGRFLRCACGTSGDQQITRTLRPGRYLAVVSAQDGAAGSYRLSRLARTVTRTRLTASTTTPPPGGAVGFTATVTPTPTGGRVHIDVERFDPLDGWRFRRRFTLPVAGGTARVTWTPPALGRWRASASFLGTRRDGPSRTGTVRILVAAPLGD